MEDVAAVLVCGSEELADSKKDTNVVAGFQELLAVLCTAHHSTYSHHKLGLGCGRTLRLFIFYFIL